MKEIKFRVWNKQLNKMWDFATMDRNKVFALDSDLPDKNFLLIPNGPEHILMQFTGLLDKNGKEIYEGDIVRFRYDDNFAGEIFETKWRAIGALCWQLQNSSGTFYLVSENKPHYEVIGNIYENPELLRTVAVPKSHVSS